MNLHLCTIILSDNSTLLCNTVEQCLSVIDDHGQDNIEKVFIDTTDGVNINAYHQLSVEESIESLMNL
ncbi:hypothetical protein L4C38_18030 [Vibrio kasasachensis]|uniref:hypothetical protein n=1 Tax=Vibrio kasasachensis TaxID=2910248 RepID=UPI003D0E2751